MPSVEKILIVDDDRFIRMALGESLRSWNYEAVEAETIAEARTVFAAEEPRLILLDIDLPDGSGLDVLREIKREHAEAIVIMITGNVQIDNTWDQVRQILSRPQRNFAKTDCIQKY